MDASSQRSPLVIIDLETTGFSKETDEVIQIAASMYDSPSSFCCCILPANDIPADVTRLTGFAKDGDVMTLRCQRVDTLPRADAVRDFLQYLRQVRGAQGDRLILVAHNAFGFDAAFLQKLVAGEGQAAVLDEVVKGFADTLPVFRAALPHRSWRHGNFKLGNLAMDFGVLDGIGPLHNADQDVVVLKRLIEKIGVVTKLVETTKPLSWSST